MSYGLSVVNNASQVLISTQTRTLHFVGKAAYSTLLGSMEQNGGMRCWRFIINCALTPVPFITMPTSDFYAVIGVRNLGGTSWAIEVLRSGTSVSIPEVYVFTDPNGITYTGSETYGMRVFCDDGSLSYDSRLSPLVVTGGGTVSPPASPVNPEWYMPARWDGSMEMTYYQWWSSQAYYNAFVASNYSYTYYQPLFQYMAEGWWHDYPFADKATGDPSAFLTPTNFAEYSIPSGVGNTKPIYFFPSFAQATRIATSDYWANDGDYRCMNHYWVLYRGGISKSGDIIRCGWVPYVKGAYWKARKVNAGITIGTGVDASSIVGAGAGGMPPYYNETLNLQPTAVIIANGVRYD